MPCLTYESPEERQEAAFQKMQREKAPLVQEIASLKQEKANLEAALCGVLTLINKSTAVDLFLINLDEKEAGVTRRQISSWFKEHKAKDELRKQEELKTKKQKALAKLTKEDREILGL